MVIPRGWRISRRRFRGVARAEVWGHVADGAFDGGCGRAFAYCGLDIAAEVFKLINKIDHLSGLGVEHTAARNERGVVYRPLTAMLA